MSKVIIKFEKEDGTPLSSAEIECKPGQEGGVVRDVWEYVEETYLKDDDYICASCCDITCAGC